MIEIKDVSKTYVSKKRKLRLFQKDFDKKTNSEEESTVSRLIYKKNLLFKKRIKYTRALHNINLHIQSGEIFGLLGPNGAGKTTLTKIISTLVLPDSGQVFVNGHNVITDPTPVRSSIGLVTGGERTLYWKLTPIENLTFFGRLYHLSREEAENRSLELIKTFNLVDKKDELVQNLSTGQKMKVAFCRALVHDPPLLLVDEAERGLDPRASKEFRNFLKEELQKKQGKTILLCTHNMDILDELCNRIALINKGSVVALDKPERLKASIKQKHILTLQTLEPLPNSLFKSFSEISQITAEKVDEFYFSKFELNNGSEIAQQIIQKAYDAEITIQEFNLKTATLEDVFLKLTGRSLEDEVEGLDE
ncbi:MAG: ATP-binding cassette domain-containing protein [Candidatus Heimdallarchaeota archaeon]|nr:ATP-binding cassette domain-containing protein [Candidatus Heimdallarchaeota archaeon]